MIIYIYLFTQMTLNQNVQLFELIAPIINLTLTTVTTYTYIIK